MKNGCTELQPWVRSISDHLYWAAATSADEPSDMIVAKWLSICNHLINKHKGHEDTLYSKCTHKSRRGRSKNKKKWLTPSMQSHEEFCKLAKNKRMLKSVKKMSTGHQTSNVESFHSIINQFAPKSNHFTFRGMQTRYV